MWIHEYPPASPWERIQAPMSRSRRVTSMSPGEFTATLDRWTSQIPNLTYRLHPFTSTIFLPFHSLAFQPAAQTWVFPVGKRWKINGNLAMCSKAKYIAAIITPSIQGLLQHERCSPLSYRKASSPAQQVQKPTAGRLPQATPSSVLPSHPGVLLSGGS